jgi:hypothetical protein
LQSLLRSKEIPMKRLFKNLFGVEKSNTRARKKSLRLGLETLEDRQLLSVYVGHDIDADNLRFLNVTCVSSVSNTDAPPADTVTVDHTTVNGRGKVSINGDLYDDSTDDYIVINGGAGGTVTNILANVKPVTVLGHSNKDIDNLGDGSLQNIKAEVWLENPPSASTVNIYDNRDSMARTPTLSSVTRYGQSFGKVTGLSDAAIWWKSADTQAVNLWLGSGASRVNVLGTGASTTILNSAAATIYVGDGSVAGIWGSLTLANPYSGFNYSSLDTVVIMDGGDTASHTVTLSTFARRDGATLGAVTGLGAAQIAWVNGETREVTLSLGSGDATVNVLGTGVPTTLYNNGDATINVGNNGHVYGIQGALLLENYSSHDTVNINDQNDTAPPHTVTLSTLSAGGIAYEGTVTGLGASQITWACWGHTSAVNLYLGAGDATVNVWGTGCTTNIFNYGDATINIGNGTLAAIQGALHLATVPTYHRVPIGLGYFEEPEFHYETINIHDENDFVYRNVGHTMNGSQETLTGLPCAPITFDTLDTAAVFLYHPYGSDQIF